MVTFTEEIIDRKVLFLCSGTRKSHTFFSVFLEKSHGEMETMFELKVFDSEGFFMIKTNITIVLHHLCYSVLIWRKIADIYFMISVN